MFLLLIALLFIYPETHRFEVLDHRFIVHLDMRIMEPLSLMSLLVEVLTSGFDLGHHMLKRAFASTFFSIDMPSGMGVYLAVFQILEDINFIDILQDVGYILVESKTLTLYILESLQKGTQIFINEILTC